MVLAQAANYAMPLILIPYLVRTLGLAGFGDFSVAQSIINVGIIVVQFGFNIYVTKLIAEKIKQQQNFDDTLSNTFILQVLLALLLISLAFIAYGLAPSRLLQLNLWYSFSWLGQALFPVWYFQGSQRFKQLALLNFFLRFSTFACVLLWVKQETDLLYVPMIYSFSYLSTGILACSVMWRHHSLQVPTLSSLVLSLNQSKDLFFSTIISSLLMNMPVFFLNHQVSKDEVGAFSAILRVVYAIKGMLTTCFQVLIPALVGGLDKLNHRSLISKLLAVLVLIVGVSLAIKHPLQSLLYGRYQTLDYNLEFSLLILSVIPGVLATLFLLVFATYYGQFARRKHAFFKVFIVAGLLYYPFIHWFNGLGAALVVLICELVLLALGKRVIFHKKSTRKGW